MKLTIDRLHEPSTIGTFGGDEMSDFYVSTFCNFAHRVADGKPIEHECFIIAPKALAEEMAGVYDGPEWAKWAKGPRRMMARGVRAKVTK